MWVLVSEIRNPRAAMVELIPRVPIAFDTATVNVAHEFLFDAVADEYVTKVYERPLDNDPEET